MNAILKSISYIFHPISMSFLGTAFYFSKSPRFLPESMIKAKLFALALLTIFLPMLLYLVLKTTGRVSSIHLASAKERIIPLILKSMIVFMILRRVFPYHEIIELYYFFVGILLTTLTCLILAILNVKASLHMAAAGGIFMFFVAISIHFNININGAIALVTIMIGAVATSRLHYKAHTNVELLFGFFVGMIPQLILLNYWL